MSKYLYKVKSKIVVVGEGACQYYNLTSIDEPGMNIFPAEMAVTLDADIEIGSTVELNFNVGKISISTRTNFNFLHHFDRPNQGDILSGPYHYFEFPFVNMISWDKYIVENKISDGMDFGGVTIIGGGIYFTNDKPRLKSLIKKSDLFVAWGIGLDPRSDVFGFLNMCSLVGTRERNSSLIDNKKIFYVPCVSCMNKVFDRDLHGGYGESKDLVLHLNGGFNEKELISSFKGVPVTTTVDSFEKIIKNLSSSKCVVTNSYHGAYWASLLGKKVVCTKTKVPKWDGLNENILFADVESLQRCVSEALPVPSSYLDECRELNNDFYKMIVSAVSSIPLTRGQE